jgi:CheY-like chemotaxis protein
MSENKSTPQPFAYCIIVAADDGVCASIHGSTYLFESARTPQPDAYVMIVEPDDAVRDSLRRTVSAPNCAVDIARDEDEAVAKALQHRPQLIIVKQHAPLSLDLLQPPSASVASRICRRARLSRAVRLVTHSDAAITFKAKTKTFSESVQRIIVRPAFRSQPWRKEWYSYCAHDMASEFLSSFIPFWLGRTKISPYLDLTGFRQFVRPECINPN